VAADHAVETATFALAGNGFFEAGDDADSLIGRFSDGLTGF